MFNPLDTEASQFLFYNGSVNLFSRKMHCKNFSLKIKILKIKKDDIYFIWTLLFQELIKKYPNIDVQIFQGGENVGKFLVNK